MLGARSEQVRFALVFAGIYFIALLFIRHRSSLDPTSVFFNEDVAHNLQYSEIRQTQSEAFIEEAIRTEQPKVDNSTRPELCVGITTFARPEHRYFKYTVGSLLHGLDPEERAKFHLILFPAHADPTVHPAYGEGWMQNVADTILTYSELEEQDFRHLRRLEQLGGNYHEKTTFDYLYLMQKCADTRAPHMVLLEDDVIALDGWYHRTRDALKVVQQMTAEKGYERFYYLRLFYTEKLFGWNSEEWFSYLLNSIFVTCAIGVVALGIRRLYLARSKSSHGQIPRMLIVQLVIYSALTILLFFATGRNTIFPLPEGVQEMPRFGCCTQGMVYPRDLVKDIAPYFHGSKTRAIDSNFEDYANSHDELRFALVPSIMQHVGTSSSRDDRFYAYKIFNFGFEFNDPNLLHEEHLQALRSTS